MPIVKKEKTLTLAKTPVLVLDCQTTGASPNSGNLLEMAWTKLEPGSISNGDSIVSHLVQQPDEEAIPRRIETLTGIRNEDMDGAVSSSFLVKQLKSTLAEITAPADDLKKPICVIHYARFEMPFLLDLFERYGRRKSLPFDVVCTFEIARRIYPNLPSRGIRAIAGYLGLELDELKRARGNVDKTGEIWRHLVEVLEEQQGITEYSDLFQFLDVKVIQKRGKLEYPLPPEKRLQLPDQAGVYRMLNRKGKVLYVGKATSLKSRVNSHFRGRKRKTSKSFELLTQVTDIEVTQCNSPLEAALIENDQIKKYDPSYNTSLKKRDRLLWFYDRDFKSISNVQSEKHQVGPFSSEFIVADVFALSACLIEKKQFEGMLYGIDDGELINEGIELFLERYSQELAGDFSVSNLLYLGMKLYRRNKNLLRAMQEEEEEQDDEAESEDIEDLDSEITKPAEDEEEELLHDLEEEEIDAEDVLARLESAVVSLARSYLLSKELTKLLEAKIDYELDDQHLKLKFNSGQISNGSEKEKRKLKKTPWKDLDICTFDRIRILITEMARMRSQGIMIKVDPDVYLLSRW